MASAFQRFFRGFVANSDLIEWTNLEERFPDEFTVAFEDTCLSYVAQGVGNNRFLAGPYFYNELQGSHALRCEVLVDGASQTRVAFTVSPMLTGSISFVRLHSGLDTVPEFSPAAGGGAAMLPQPLPPVLPQVVSLGSAASVRIGTRLGPFRVQALVQVRPEFQVDDPERFGVHHWQSIVVELPLEELTRDAFGRRGFAAVVRASFAHFDRGDFRAALYAFGTDAQTGASLFRGPGDVRQGAQAVLSIDIPWE
jgi:hypothetical protein